MNKLKTLTLSISALLFFCCAGNSYAYLTATQVESIACVSYTQDTGGDPLACSDESLPTCQVPDWFPVLADGDIASQYESKSTGPARWNLTEFGSGNWQHWEHTWFSDNGVPYGPAIPTKGHEWNEYNGDELVRSFTCNSKLSYSYP